MKSQIVMFNNKKCVGGVMHNLISRNQLAEWKYIEENFNRCKEELELVNDYFDCLIECDEDQSTCKRICRIILDEGG